MFFDKEFKNNIEEVHRMDTTIIDEKMKQQTIKIDNLEEAVSTLKSDVKGLEGKVMDLTSQSIKNSEQTVTLFNAVEQMTQSTKEISKNFELYNQKLEAKIDKNNEENKKRLDKHLDKIYGKLDHNPFDAFVKQIFFALAQTAILGGIAYSLLRK